MTNRDPWWLRPLSGCTELLLGILGAIVAWAYLRSLRQHDEANHGRDDEQADTVAY